ncbi:MAG: hypothetical protein NTX03_07605 [Bacteroidetes bacterium]|nr:hypothetical protein [Bacteroidota bacterium]
MLTAFYQKTLLEERKITISDNGLYIWHKEPGYRSSYFVKFELIRRQTSTYFEGKTNFLWYAFICIFLGVLQAVLLINQIGAYVGVGIGLALLTGVALHGMYYFTSQEYLVVPLSDGTNFTLISNRPSSTQVQQFLSDMIKARNEYIRKNYFIIDYGSSRRDEQTKMRWLLDEGIITNSEFEVVIEEIENELQ